MCTESLSMYLKKSVAATTWVCKAAINTNIFNTVSLLTLCLYYRSTKLMSSKLMRKNGAPLSYHHPITPKLPDKQPTALNGQKVHEKTSKKQAHVF